MTPQNNSIIIYQTSDGQTSIDVKLENETVWLNRQQLADLFDRDVKTIGKHINNALKEELAGELVVAKFATAKKYGRQIGHTQIVKVEYYNLDLMDKTYTHLSRKRRPCFFIL